MNTSPPSVHRLILIPALLLAATPAAARPSAPQHETSRALDPLLRHGRTALARESAALLLGLAGNRAASTALTAALREDTNRWVRGRAAEALGRLGDRHAIPALKRALGRAKDPTVRRDIAGALLRLGDRSGLLELMWQLRSGRHYDKAEAMRALVAATGQPLGQDIKAWWTYLAARGYAQIASRKRASPSSAWRHLARAQGATTTLGVRGWRELCVTVLDVGPTRMPLTAPRLRRAVTRQGGLDDGCLILLRTAWRSAKLLPPREAPRAHPLQVSRAPRHPPTPPSARPHGPLPSSTSASTRSPANAAPPGLTLEGLRYLETIAPALAGIALDTPRLDLPGPGAPVRDALAAAHKLALTGVTAPPWMAARQRRALAIRIGSSGPQGEPTILLLVHVP